MNTKHLACVVLAFVAILLLQGALSVRNRLTKMTAAAEAAQANAFNLANVLKAEATQLTGLREDSTQLVAYVETWRDALSQIHSPEAGELNVAARIKESGLVSLSQRFEVVNSTFSANITRIVRANLTFEDDYAKTMNWLGNLESSLPASRVANLRIARGQSGNDIRLDVTIDLPLLSAEPAAPPQ